MSLSHEPPYLLSPILYLESKDFTIKKHLKHSSLREKTAIVMVQANKCGHCSSAKPAFQKFAEKNKDIACLTIQCNMGNSTEEEKKLMNIVLELKPDFQGFPDYMKFVNGKYIREEISGRDEKALQKFVTK
jgi:thiol-disulfide isomerase/thioredoxin